MKDLVILGSGVHGLEMAEIVERANRAGASWNLLGFLAAPGEQTRGERGGLKILGGAEDMARFPEACFVPDNEFPRDFPVERGRLVSLVDPSVFVSASAVIGRGCVIYPNCYIGRDARLGDYVFCLAGCVINHDDAVEDRVVFASAVALAGHVHVESDCYLGQSSTVRQYLRIGRNSMLGMGAVVIKDVPPSSVMVGNPARKLRDR